MNLETLVSLVPWFCVCLIVGLIVARDSPTGKARVLPPKPDDRGPASLRRTRVIVTMAGVVGGGIFGVLGAFIQEIQTGGLLVAFVGGPIIEEFLKPAGLYVLLARRPDWLGTQRTTALLAALSGLMFGMIESAVYVFVYFPEQSDAFILFRFTVPVAVHTLASFIAGFGINARLAASIRGELPLLGGNGRFFAAAIFLHAAYNIAGFVATTVFGFFQFS